MRRILKLLAANVILIAPALAIASPPGGSPNRTTSSTAAPGNGQTNGQGYNHMHTQAQANGQPNQSCQASGTTPGNAGSAPGGGSPFINGPSTAGSHYAGQQPQNSRNSASVAQYDVACTNQSH